MLICSAVPLAMMGGNFRPILAALCVLLGLFLGWRALKRPAGTQLPG
jgi:hypothetical protein